MQMEFDIHLYGAGYKGIETPGLDGAASNGSPDFGTTPSVEFYLLLQNPVDKVAYDAMTDKVPYNDWVSYDGVLSTLEVTFTAATAGPPATPDTSLKVGKPAALGSDNFTKDLVCFPSTDAGKYASSSCKGDDNHAAGGTNDYAVPSPSADN